MAQEPQVIESSFVAPSERTAKKRLWLSAFDVVNASKGHTPTVYFYRSDGGAADFFDVARLKAALAKALVAFCPLAGRLAVDDRDGRPQIDCNDEGALFVVARSDDLTVDDFRDVIPSAELRRLFVPRVEPASIMMAIQVTFLKCGGVVIGAALHHSAIDAASAFHFFQTWASLCRDGDGAAVELPCHDRALLRARSPPVVHPDTLSVFCPKLTITKPLGHIVTKCFAISKDQIATLKHKCGGASTFCSLSALVWKCLCVARQLPPDTTTRLSFAANARRSLRPPLPDGYFGNACVWLYASAAARDITTETLAVVAARIKAPIRRMDDEIVRSSIDYFELAERGECDWPVKGCMPQTEVRMNSWLGMPMYDADFGWGMPRLMSRAETIGAGFVNLSDGWLGDEEDGHFVRVLMSMEAPNLEEFQRLLYAMLK